MKLANRYIFKELTWGWLSVTLILAAALLINQLAQILSQAAERGYPHAVILPLIAFMSLQNLTVLIPIGLLLGVVLVLGRLYYEREMDALGACGYGPRQLLTPVMTLTGMVMSLLLVLGGVLAPQAFHQAETLRQEAVRLAPISQLEPKVFHRLVHDEAVFYADDRAADGQLLAVFLARSTRESTQVILAKRAYLNTALPTQQLVLSEGVRYDIPVHGLKVIRTYFESQQIALDLGAQTANERRVEGRGTLELLSDASRLASAEWQWRVSMPLMALLLGLWAIPLARLRPRESRWLRIFQTILIYFIYANLLTAARTWFEKGSVPLWLGLWWVHACMAVWIGLSWWRQWRWR